MTSSLKRFLLLLLLLLVPQTAAWAESTRGGPGAGSSASPQATIYLFWTATCPHCAKARSFVERLAARRPQIAVRDIELSGQETNELAFAAACRHFDIDPPAVPLLIVGNEPFLGFDEDETTGAEIEAKVQACLSEGCADSTGELIARATTGGAPASTGSEAEDGAGRQGSQWSLRERITLPIVGEIETRALSLPVLTLVLGAVDGFNPCAMWVLVFLIGLLVGMKDPIRMWSYGGAFLLTSGAVYFAFMAAWLNVFLLLGSLTWIRAAVGLFAIAAAGYYLREFVRNPEAVCPVTTPGERQGVMDRMRRTVTERSFMMAIGGIVVLAVAVNAIELLCSAGLPAVYTQVLALNDLSAPGYYAYIALYVAVFMLDDALIFVSAMLTLQMTGLAASYSRYAHLIGGAVLGVVGLLLLFEPQWLSLV